MYGTSDDTAILPKSLYFPHLWREYFQADYWHSYGANHCVHVANLYLPQYERMFFNTVTAGVHTLTPTDSNSLSVMLRFMGRFIDDELCLTHNPSLFLRFLPQTHAQLDITGIYPHLSFKVTSGKPNSTSRGRYLIGWVLR